MCSDPVLSGSVYGVQGFKHLLKAETGVKQFLCIYFKEGLPPPSLISGFFWKEHRTWGSKALVCCSTISREDGIRRLGLQFLSEIAKKKPTKKMKQWFSKYKH